MQSDSSSIVENTLKNVDYVDPQNSTPFIRQPVRLSFFTGNTIHPRYRFPSLTSKYLFYFKFYGFFLHLSYGKMARNSLLQQGCLGNDD